MTADRWCWCTRRSSIARALDYANEVSRLRDLATSIRIRSPLQQGSHTSATYFREADSDSRSPHPISTLTATLHWSTLPAQSLSGPETMPHRSKTWAKAYTFIASARRIVEAHLRYLEQRSAGRFLNNHRVPAG